MELEDMERQNSKSAVNESEKEEIARIYLKTHRQGKETLIAVCDSDLLGKQFREGNLHIDVYPDFYGEEEASLSEVENALLGATMANFVGCKAVRHAILLGYVDEENVLSIDGILYAQMVRM